MMERSGSGAGSGSPTLVFLGGDGGGDETLGEGRAREAGHYHILEVCHSLTHFLQSCRSGSGRTREYVSENLHAIKKSLGQTTEYTQSGDCQFLAKLQETAQYSKNGFYKQVLDFHGPFKILCHT
jgi:hypothetical protein